MNKEKPVIIDIGSNCREFRRTIKMTPEEMELFNEELRHIGRIARISNATETISCNSSYVLTGPPPSDKDGNRGMDALPAHW